LPFVDSVAKSKGREWFVIRIVVGFDPSLISYSSGEDVCFARTKTGSNRSIATYVVLLKTLGVFQRYQARLFGILLVSRYSICTVTFRPKYRKYS
jgi:hypothetical protein